MCVCCLSFVVTVYRPTDVMIGYRYQQNKRSVHFCCNESAHQAYESTSVAWVHARFGHSAQAMKEGYTLSKCEADTACVCHRLQSVQFTNDWVLDKAGVSRNLLESVKARKLTYFGHIMRKKSESLEKQMMQGTTPGSRTRGRPKAI